MPRGAQTETEVEEVTTEKRYVVSLRPSFEPPKIKGVAVTGELFRRGGLQFGSQAVYMVAEDDLRKLTIVSPGRFPQDKAKRHFDPHISVVDPVTGAEVTWEQFNKEK